MFKPTAADAVRALSLLAAQTALSIQKSYEVGEECLGGVGGAERGDVGEGAIVFHCTCAGILTNK